MLQLLSSIRSKRVGKMVAGLRQRSNDCVGRVWKSIRWRRPQWDHLAVLFLSSKSNLIFPSCVLCCRDVENNTSAHLVAYCCVQKKGDRTVHTHTHTHNRTSCNDSVMIIIPLELFSVFLDWKYSVHPFSVGFTKNMHRFVWHSLRWRK